MGEDIHLMVVAVAHLAVAFRLEVAALLLTVAVVAVHLAAGHPVADPLEEDSLRMGHQVAVTLLVEVVLRLEVAAHRAQQYSTG